MTIATRSGNIFYPHRLRRGHARGRNCGRGCIPLVLQSTSGLSSETSSQSASHVRSSRVQWMFSINLRQISNPPYQEDPETSERAEPLNNTFDYLFKGSFQSQRTQTERVPAMGDYEPEQGDHSRHQEIPRNDTEKDHDTEE